MINIAAINSDENRMILLRQMVNDYIEETNNRVNLFTFNSEEELYASALNNGSFNIYFISIELDENKGLDLAIKIRQTNKKSLIIFVSYDTDHAIDSYEVKAFNYLVRPVSRVKLYKVLDECINFVKENHLEYYDLKLKNGTLLRIPLSNINYIRKLNRCAEYGLSNGTRLCSSTIRRSLEDEVKHLLEYPDFEKVGAGLIINLDNIDSIGRDIVTMKNGETIYPPTNNMKGLYNAIKKYWTSM